MKIVIAMDSFKGSLSSVQAGNAAAEGIKRAIPDAETVVLPIADGGEGTVEALVSGLGGEFAEAKVSDPIGRKITARYGLLPGAAAVIETADAVLYSPPRRAHLPGTSHSWTAVCGILLRSPGLSLPILPLIHQVQEQPEALDLH